MLEWLVRDVTRDDLEAVRAVNDDNQPNVGALDDARIELFLLSAPRFQVVEFDGTIVGVFVGLAEGLPYDSPNYRWFSDRHERFAYVDRIALQPEARGLGVAVDLYDDFARWAYETSRPVLCAEVNVEPPNLRSMRFHHRQGFEEVGEERPYGGDERVAMLERPTRHPG